MSVRLRRRVQTGEEMKKKKNGLHCVMSDQPLNFDLILTYACKAIKKAIGILLKVIISKGLSYSSNYK